jgi:hypothetical protein
VSLCAPPGIEIPLLPREREPSHPGLEIDHVGLQAVRGRDHLLRAPRIQGTLVETEDREKENAKDNRQPE